MAQQANARKAKKVEAHWYPILWYIWVVKRTVTAPQKERRKVLAARAEAAWDW